MKKFISFAFCILVSSRIFAYYVDGVYYSFNSSTNTATVINLYVDDEYAHSYRGDVVIPATVVYDNKTYTVTRIGKNAFYDCEDLTSVSLPLTITTIGESAFNYCTELSSIELPTTITSIATKAFYGCRSLTSINIPSSLTTIYEATFQGCSGLTSLVIPNSVTKIEDRAFCNCSGLTSLVIPNSVTKIGDLAFCNCSGLTSVSISESVKQIGKGVFYDCTSLPVFNHIRYADSYLVKVVDSELESYSIKEGTKWIGSEAFYYCLNMKNITLPSSLKQIGEKSLYQCTHIEKVVCYAPYPPNMSTDCMREWPKNATLYVPAENISQYRKAWWYGGWGEFFENILPIMAEQVSVTEVAVIPLKDGVTIMWPMGANESLFTIEIKHGDDIIWTFTFNREGYLLSLNFEESTSVSNRKLSNATMASNGLQYTIMGLEENTEYTYTITIRDASIQPIKTYNGSFKTTEPTGLEELTIDEKVGNKFIYGNQLYIRRGYNLYTATGARVK
ncbi:MAG: leucine-rich repeat domain-containing protein [Paludibacteraceae bacterium]|nr:leucine-rich repeat domain-containing protein [Paludibacteraceae bacterium]